MTTIVSDGKVMVADGLGSLDSGRIVERDGSKVRKLEDGSLLGIAGSAFGLDLVGDWLEAGGLPADRPKDLKVEVMVLHPDGEIEGCGDSMMLERWCPPCGIGSGAEFAIGAMAAGKTAKEAVEIAATLDINTGGIIQTFRPAKPRRNR